jgi:two-component system OmpR family response regulator
LVVEDDARLRSVLERAFRESGHSVDAAADGTEGEAMAARTPYDAIVLDAMLPGMDGVAVVRSLRRKEVKSPIVFLTARATSEDAIAGLDAGADDYMRKPFDIGELEARLRSISRRENGERVPELRVGDVVYEPATRRAARDGRELGLSPRETACLEYFMRNAGRVVTREMMTVALWGYDAEIASNVVDVYVRRLRAKLEWDGAARLLHTVRGHGYRFGPQ